MRIRGFAHSVRVKGRRGFLILRSGADTVQCTYSHVQGDSACLDAEVFSLLSKTAPESFVEVEGTLQKTGFPIKSCSVQDREVLVQGFMVISAASDLPFSMRDVSAPEKEKENKNIATVAYNKRLDFRALDLRTPHSQAIFRVIDSIMHMYRSVLRKNGFVEIKTPKLIEAASEGGANCFSVDFFRRKAFLAQSPQLYKQMAVIGGLRRVYEVGHVYRAEESNINRYLSEFVGLDLEMEISTSYTEVYLFVYRLLTSIFGYLETECREDLETIRRFRHFDDITYGSEPLVLTYRECVEMLRKNGVNMEYGADFNREAEKMLGAIVKREHGVDLFIVESYPLAVRAFYTKRSDADSTMSNSYDFILRGEEILSGAQRISDYSELLDSVDRAGISRDSVRGYLETFRLGVPPHGGAGIGLERLVKAYFGFSDIRYFSMFPRDPARLYP
ncbi:UNVERIFIED_CONTAM: hypothetical protein PYX00_011617 [Menopon gallinae]|uniref:Aspartate--tRNA ligase, cytoplasmic n=1 Tax=Menopon gallinae TaxID=328185 RepID=A0AAW2H837_9NEOP